MRSWFSHGDSRRDSQESSQPETATDMLEASWQQVPRSLAGGRQPFCGSEDTRQLSIAFSDETGGGDNRCSPFDDHSRVRIAQLEEALASERQRCEQKQDELDKLYGQLHQLEGAVEEQAIANTVEQRRLSTLEEAMKSQQNCQEEKVAKLLLALAAKTELAQRTKEAEEKRRLECESEISELKRQLADRELAIDNAKDDQAYPCSCLQEEQTTCRIAEDQLEVRDLQQQLGEEIAKRQILQNHLISKAKDEHEPKRHDKQIMLQQDRSEDDRSESVALLKMQKELCDIRQQLADELGTRRALQYSIIERERLLCDLQHQLIEVQQQRDNQPMCGPSTETSQKPEQPVVAKVLVQTPGTWEFRQVQSSQSVPGFVNHAPQSPGMLEFRQLQGASSIAAMHQPQSPGVQLRHSPNQNPQGFMFPAASYPRPAWLTAKGPVDPRHTVHGYVQNRTRRPSQLETLKHA